MRTASSSPFNPFLHSFKKSALADFFYGHSLRKGGVAIAAVARMAARGSMPFCVELDNLKDTDAPIHQPAAMLVAAD